LSAARITNLKALAGPVGADDESAAQVRRTVAAIAKGPAIRRRDAGPHRDHSDRNDVGYSSGNDGGTAPSSARPHRRSVRTLERDVVGAREKEQGCRQFAPRIERDVLPA